jgi:hypothetical protein
MSRCALYPGYEEERESGATEARSGTQCLLFREMEQAQRKLLSGAEVLSCRHDR